MSKRKVTKKTVKRGKKPVRKAIKKSRLVRATKSPTDSAIPYRETSNYGQLYVIGSRKMWDKDDLIRTASKDIGKSQKCIEFDLNVLTSPGHSSNGNRSANDPAAKAQGKIRLIDKRVLVGGHKPVVRKMTVRKTTVKKVTVTKVAAPTPAPVPTAAPAPVPVQAPAPVASTPAVVPTAVVPVPSK